jgi:microcystin-dependent protein
MQRVNRSSAVPSLPAAPASPGLPGYFTGGNPALGQAATVPGYEWFNAVQEELIGVIARGGLTASNADLAQVRKSLDRLFGGGLVGFSANATLSVDDAGMVLVNASGGARTITLPAANALGGRPIRYQIEKTDSTANTVTVQRAGTDMIESAGSVVLSGQWASVTLVSDGLGAWVTLRPNIPAATSGVAGLTRYATIAEAVAGSADNLAVTPAGLGALLTGMIAFFPATAAPTGWLKANGALVSRATFFNLWAVAQASGNLVTDAAWLAANGPTGAFSQGDGSTTFRIPDLRGEFIRGFDDGRGADASRGIGTSQGDAIRNLTGSFGPFRQALSGTLAAASGVFSLGTASASGDANNGSSNVISINLSASNQVPTAAENRPRNIALLACIKF